MTHERQIQRPPRALTIPSSLNFLAPGVCDDLIRVGNAYDGGYVIPDHIIREADFLLSFGISDDWSFEERFKELNPNVHIHAYDHTISKRDFQRGLQLSILRACVGRSSLTDLKMRYRLLKSYSSFFTGSVRHFQERIHSRLDRPNDATLDKIFARTRSKRIFLKADIEGSEYRIVNDILKFRDRIAGMVIEFHDIEPLRQVFVAAVKALLESFEIVHLHANNCGGVARDGLPETLELTFVHKSGDHNGRKRTILPLIAVDAPNIPTIEDYSIEFLP